MIFRLANRQADDVRRKLRMNGIDVTGDFTTTAESILIDAEVVKTTGTRVLVRSLTTVKVRDNVLLVTVTPGEVDQRSNYARVLFPGHDGPVEASISSLPAGAKVQFRVMLMPVGTSHS